ncbi:MAG: ferrochelatase [Alphaproteobacteria bacterium]|jgi:ferrochelatase
MKIAIVLFNLGGPTDLESVRPFLFNLFKDKNIIRLPAIIRYPLGYLISRLRSKKATNIYTKLGGGSPINAETQKQANTLNQMLEAEKEDFKVFYCMQYWHPMHPEIINNVSAYNPDKIILLPLYPQFSTTTTKSSFEVWFEKSKKLLGHISHYKICCYPENAGFIQAYGDLTIEKLKHSDYAKDAVVLCSAHGIPQDCVDDGDPYEEQISKTAGAIEKYLNQKGYDNKFIITYQSKVGPKKWLEPDTETSIETLSKEKKPLVIIPLAFTSEHSETLVELDIDYKNFALSLGCPDYMRVPTVSYDAHYISGLKTGIMNIINHNITSNPSICSDKMKECPKKTHLTPCITI